MKNLFTFKFLVVSYYFAVYPLSNCWSQDIHFSQFYDSPLNLNPAMTGGGGGGYRLAANYRRQWASIPPGNPFETYATSFDMVIPTNLIKTGNISGGLQAFQDQSGLANLTNQTVLASISYRTFINNNTRYQIAGGLQGGVVIKKIDYSNLTFNNQFTDNYFDNSMPSGEPLSDNSLSYFDLHVGVMLNSVINQKIRSTTGISVYHITQPNESFIGNSTNKLNSRYVFHGGIKYILNSQAVLSPDLIFMSQGKAQEINLGCNIFYQLKGENLSNSTIYGGSWIRVSAANKIIDAIIPTIGIQYKQWKFGFSYDVNLSSLKAATSARGGPEIAIIYIADLAGKIPIDPILPCIRY